MQGGGVPEEESLDLRRYWSAVLRYRWGIVLLTILGLAGGFGATKLLKPKYLAQGTIWIEVGDQRGGAGIDRGPIRSSELLDAEAWIELLKSYVVLDDVVRHLRLFLKPAAAADSVALSSFSLADRFRPGEYRLAVDDSGKTFTLSAPGGMVLQRGAVGDSVGRAFGFLWVLPSVASLQGRTMTFTVLTPRDAAHRLADDLLVQMQQDAKFLKLSLQGTDGAQTANIVNAVMGRFVEVAADLKRAKLIELTNVLDAQLRASEQNLRNAETSLETFRVQTITLPSERSTPVIPGLETTRDPVFSNYFNMKIELEQDRRDAEAIQRVLSAPPDSELPLAGLEGVGAVQHSAELSDALKELTTKQADLRALRYRYTDASPTVQRRASEIDTLEHLTIPKLAQGVLDALGDRDRVLQSRIDGAGGELREIPARAIEEARLRRQVAIDENLYTTLQQRYQEARLADASSIPDVRVLDAAVTPESPIKDTAARVILLGLVGGLAVGVVGAVALDRFDSRLHYPDQVTRELGLPILGALPHVRAGGNGKKAADTAQVIEALRGIRLNLVHAYGSAGPLMLTISSPGSGDGKSFLSSNLALAFGDGGYRTLLIDGDVRRGTLHRLLGGSRKPGLTDYLAGTASRESIVQPTGYPSVSFIASGTRQHTSPELLGSPALAELLSAMRPTYNVILVDSPPLGAGVDPFVLGAATRNMILVLRTGATDKQMARAKLEVLERLPIRLLGAVLNDVPEIGMYYRYYSYLSGYATEDEQQFAARQLPGMD